MSNIDMGEILFNVVFYSAVAAGVIRVTRVRRGRWKAMKQVRNALAGSRCDVFISYRRDDRQKLARQIYRRLKDGLDFEEVFLDSKLKAGLDFDKQIEVHLSRSRVVVVVIGPEWIGRREGAQNRILERDDFVRREVATALKIRQARVIPVLVENAVMPSASELPRELHGLTLRQAVSISPRNPEKGYAKLVKAVRKGVKASRGW